MPPTASLGCQDASVLCWEQTRVVCSLLANADSCPFVSRALKTFVDNRFLYIPWDPEERFDGDRHSAVVW